MTPETEPAVDERIGFTVRVLPDEHDRLRRLAEREHRTLGAQVRLMLLDALTREAA